MPKIIGRCRNNGCYERADTITGPAERSSFVSGVEGTASVETFASTDDEDRGGVVLRFEILDSDDAFLPCARETEHGVELHFTGQEEARSLINVLKAVLEQL